jgi:hypothetical protein
MVEYDCAHGTIDEPLVPDDAGRFEAKGTFVLERGGPLREGETLETHAARYVGRMDGKTMTLTVTLIDTSQTVRTFSLALGAPPRIVKCL